MSNLVLSKYWVNYFKRGDMLGEVNTMTTIELIINHESDINMIHDFKTNLTLVFNRSPSTYMLRQIYGKHNITGIKFMAPIKCNIDQFLQSLSLQMIHINGSYKLPAIPTLTDLRLTNCRVTPRILNNICKFNVRNLCIHASILETACDYGNFRDWLQNSTTLRSLNVCNVMTGEFSHEIIKNNSIMHIKTTDDALPISIVRDKSQLISCTNRSNDPLVQFYVNRNIKKYRNHMTSLLYTLIALRNYAIPRPIQLLIINSIIGYHYTIKYGRYANKLVGM